MIEKVADHLTLIEVALGSLFEKVGIHNASSDTPTKNLSIKAAHFKIFKLINGNVLRGQYVTKIKLVQNFRVLKVSP